MIIYCYKYYNNMFYIIVINKYIFYYTSRYIASFSVKACILYYVRVYRKCECIKLPQFQLYQSCFSNWMWQSRGAIVLRVRISECIETLMLVVLHCGIHYWASFYVLRSLIQLYNSRDPGAGKRKRLSRLRELEI